MFSPKQRLPEPLSLIETVDVAGNVRRGVWSPNQPEGSLCAFESWKPVEPSEGSRAMLESWRQRWEDGDRAVLIEVETVFDLL